MIVRTATAQEVAKNLGISAVRIRALAREEKIPANRIGGAWRFNLDEVRRILVKETGVGTRDEDLDF